MFSDKVLQQFCANITFFLYLSCYPLPLRFPRMWISILMLFCLQLTNHLCQYGVMIKMLHKPQATSHKSQATSRSFSNSDFCMSIAPRQASSARDNLLVFSRQLCRNSNVSQRFTVMESPDSWALNSCSPDKWALRLRRSWSEVFQKFPVVWSFYENAICRRDFIRDFDRVQKEVKLSAGTFFTCFAGIAPGGFGQ